MLQCTDTKFTKNFTLGAGASSVREGTKLCQFFLAQNCATSNNDACLNVFSDDKFMPGYDVLNRPIQQTINEAYIRNTALMRYMKSVPNCHLVHNQIDAQNSHSPSVFEWRNQADPTRHCAPILTMTPAQICAYVNQADYLIPLLLAHAPLFDDILGNIRATMIVEKTWHQLEGTPAHTYFEKRHVV